MWSLVITKVGEGAEGRIRMDIYDGWMYRYMMDIYEYDGCIYRMYL